MRAESYRGYQIDCTVTKGNIGKPSSRWHCELKVCPPGQIEGKHYEVELNAWTAKAARDQSVQYTKALIDAELGPERFLPQEVPPDSAHTEDALRRSKRIDKVIASVKQRLE